MSKTIAEKVSWKKKMAIQAGAGIPIVREVRERRVGKTCSGPSAWALQSVFGNRSLRHGIKEETA